MVCAAQDNHRTCAAAMYTHEAFTPTDQQRHLSRIATGYLRLLYSYSLGNSHDGPCGFHNQGWIHATESLSYLSWERAKWSTSEISSLQVSALDSRLYEGLIFLTDCKRANAV